MPGIFDDIPSGGTGLFDDIPTAPNPTLGERIGAGILSGLSGAIRATKAPVDLVNTLAPNPLTQGASDFLQTGIDAARDVAPDSIKAQRERPILTRFADGDVDFQLPNATQIVDVLAESAPLIPGLLTSGQAISRLPQALGAGKGLSQAIGFGAANAAFVAPAAGDEVRREALARGDTEEQARAAQLTAAGLMTPISALTGGAGLSLAARLGAGRSPLSGAVRGFVADAPFEGIEEGAESAVQDLALDRPVDPIRAGSAAALGTIAGGLPGAAAGALEGAATAPRDPIDPSKPAGPIVRAALAAPALVPQIDPQAAADEQRRADAADQRAADVYAARKAEELRRQKAYQELGIYDPAIGADLPPTGGIEVQDIASFDDLIPKEKKAPPPSTKGIEVREATEKDIQQAGGESITLAEDKPAKPGSIQVGNARPSELAPAERAAYDEFVGEREREAAAARAEQEQARAAAETARRDAQRNQPEIRADNGEPFKTVPAANAARKKLEAPDDYEVKRLDKGQFVLARKANEQAQEPAAEVAAAGDGRTGGDAPRGDARAPVDGDGPGAGLPGGDAQGAGRGDAAALPVGDRAAEPAAALTETSNAQQPAAPAGTAEPAVTERIAATGQPEGAPPAESPAPAPVARPESIRREDGTAFPTALAANVARAALPDKTDYRVQKVADGEFELRRVNAPIPADQVQRTAPDANATDVQTPATAPVAEGQTPENAAVSAESVATAQTERIPDSGIPNTPTTPAAPEAGAASTPSGQASTTPAVDAAPASVVGATEQPAQAQGGEPLEGAGRTQPTPAPEATAKDSSPVAAADWWDKELTSEGRRQAMEKIGLKRPNRIRWNNVPDEAKRKLEAMRGTPDDPMAPAEASEQAPSAEPKASEQAPGKEPIPMADPNAKKPRLAESGKDLRAAIEREGRDGRYINGERLPVVVRGAIGGDFQLRGEGWVKLEKGGMATRPATTEEVADIEDAIEKDHVQVLALTRPGYGSGDGAQQVVEELHSPSARWSRAAGPTAQADDASSKAAAEKAAQRAAKDAERDVFNAAASMPGIQKLAMTLTADSFGPAASAVMRTWVTAEADKARAGNDEERARALDGVKIDEDMLAALFKEAGKKARQAEREAGRDPAIYKAKLAELLAENNVAGSPELTTAFQRGFDHALAGKTKSTLSGDRAAVMQDGYESARAWMDTEEGRNFFEGKRASKLQNTGVDLKRWFDIARETLKGKADSAEQFIAQLSKATARADLFPTESGTTAARRPPTTKPRPTSSARTTGAMTAS